MEKRNLLEVQCIAIILGNRNGDNLFPFIVPGEDIRCGFSERNGETHAPGKHYGKPSIVIGFKGDKNKIYKDVSDYLNQYNALRIIPKTLYIPLQKALRIIWQIKVMMHGLFPPTLKSRILRQFFLKGIKL